MTVVAHAGHWLVQAIYLAPLVVLVGILVFNQVKERRERRAGTDQGDDAGAVPTGGGTSSTAPPD